MKIGELLYYKSGVDDSRSAFGIITKITSDRGEGGDFICVVRWFDDDLERDCTRQAYEEFRQNIKNIRKQWE